MKKYLALALALAAMSACQQKPSPQQLQAQAERDSLQQVVQQRDAEINDIMATFNDIQESLREINQAEGRINLESGNPEKSARQDVIESISFIRRTMQLNKERIARLSQQLKASSLGVTKLKETIEELNRQLTEKEEHLARLEAQLSEKDATIAQQSEQISSLHENVTSLTASNEQKSQTVARQDEQLHTAWYVFGTKRELKDQRILSGGETLKTSGFNQDYFTQIDIREVKTVKLYSKSAKLLTTHPEGSYVLERDAQKQYTLRIKDPETFWSVSRYLVVLVK